MSLCSATTDESRQLLHLESLLNVNMIYWLASLVSLWLTATDTLPFNADKKFAKSARKFVLADEAPERIQIAVRHSADRQRGVASRQQRQHPS